ncbi:hypothetical protein CY35_13G018900 [Sphagnum magellanicum]|nr:hypothetical protein CY35_13G018900 [Sphagnum magellanicum]
MRTHVDWFLLDQLDAAVEEEKGAHVGFIALPSLLLFSSCVLSLALYLGAQLCAFFWSCLRRWKKLFFVDRSVLPAAAAAASPRKYRESPTVVSSTHGAALTQSLLLKSNAVTFTYEELRIATGGFSRKHRIGVGAYAKVYKASLPDGTVVAVKKLNGRGKRNDREFRAEIETIGNVKHTNLVRLLGYCRTKDSGQKLLVYEYFQNGSLNKYIRGGREKCLDWQTRLKIASGAAQALAYLHNCEPRIIHRDVKASNILLDTNFEAKVGDFGLAKILDSSETHITTFLAGTRAYIAPEYSKSLRLTVKCDVYSFGVLLLELVTGKDPSRGRSFNLVAWVKTRLRKTTTTTKTCSDLFDSRFLKEQQAVSTSIENNYSSHMLKVVHLALRCTNSSPEQRPSMDEVAEQLSKELSEFAC